MTIAHKLEISLVNSGHPIALLSSSMDSGPVLSVHSEVKHPCSCLSRWFISSVSFHQLCFSFKSKKIWKSLFNHTGEQIADHNLGIVLFSRWRKCWGSLPVCEPLSCWCFHPSSAWSFRSQRQWGQPTQSSLQREQDLPVDTIQAEEQNWEYGWLRAVI